MAFFNFSTGPDGREALKVSDRWWLFVAVTVPLTLLVWIFWQRWRAKRKEIAVQLEFGDDLETSNEIARR